LEKLKAKLGEILSKMDKSESYTGFGKRNSVLPVDKKESHYPLKGEKSINMIYHANMKL